MSGLATGSRCWAAAPGMGCSWGQLCVSLSRTIQLEMLTASSERGGGVTHVPCGSLGWPLGASSQAVRGRCSLGIKRLSPVLRRAPGACDCYSRHCGLCTGFPLISTGFVHFVSPQLLCSFQILLKCLTLACLK